LVDRDVLGLGVAHSAFILPQVHCFGPFFFLLRRFLVDRHLDFLFLLDQVIEYTFLSGLGELISPIRQALITRIGWFGWVLLFAYAYSFFLGLLGRQTGDIGTS
jgi:hypothetical protein